MGSGNFGQIKQQTVELSALESLKHTPIDLQLGKSVSNVSWLFLIRSSWYLRIMKICIKAWLSLDFSQI